MNWQLLIPLLITTVVAVAGWFAAHRLAASRDRANKRREMRVSVLIEAYRVLEFSVQRAYNAESSPPIERALADVLLLGSPVQTETALRMMRQFGTTQSVDWGPLLLDLRRDIRAELKLAPAPGDLARIRFVKPTLDT